MASTKANLSLTASLVQAIKRASDKEKAVFLQRYFKTGKGEYGEGDIFLGLTVPAQRQIAKQFVDMPLVELSEVLMSIYHEFRLTALLILTYKFSRLNGAVSSDSAATSNKAEKERERIYKFYLKHKSYINNWDLVDSSARDIVGGFLFDKPRDMLYKLAVSKSLWDRRIAIIATFYFIKRQQFDDTLKIAELLMNDKEDLIHKAVGWMLREVGNEDEETLKKFLNIYAPKMPRTMLRYAIERLSIADRAQYMMRPEHVKRNRI